MRRFFDRRVVLSGRTRPVDLANLKLRAEPTALVINTPVRTKRCLVLRRRMGGWPGSGQKGVILIKPGRICGHWSDA